MLKSKISIKWLSHFSAQNITANICIVGAGPAGFYAAQQILKSFNSVKVDIMERLPVPYGLVRYGVAPDHPEVKNVINTFEKIAQDKRVQFLGNINVGIDVSIRELKEYYDAVLLSYGAEKDKTLNIPGENLNNVVSAKSFVGWYNGVPQYKNLNVNLNTEDVVVLGQGNVAIDIARILLSSVDKLKNTDITSYSLETLSQSKVKRVWLAGRRGPLQAAYTIAELREMLKLDYCKTCWRAHDFIDLKEITKNLARPRKRLTELMLKSVEDTENDTQKCKKEFRPIFYRSPMEILGSNNAERVKFSVNKLVGEDMLKQIATPTNEFEEISCGLVLRSIGYESIQIDQNIPFDPKYGKILNSAGKVENNLYTAGWVATGSTGVILSTMNNAFSVAQLMSKELKLTEQKSGFCELKKLLLKNNVHPVTYEGWKKIDKEECKRGKKLGKSREKIVDISEMLRIALGQ